MKCPNCSAVIDTDVAYTNAECYGDRQMLVACGGCGCGVSFFAERVVKFHEVAIYEGERETDDWGEELSRPEKKGAKP